MQLVIAFFLLLAVAAHEWPSPLGLESDSHRLWAVVFVQVLLSGVACCGWGRLLHRQPWFPLLCWTVGSTIVTVGLGWSQWVSQHWGTVPSLGALLILGPHLASLLFVWAVPLTLAHRGTPPSPARHPTCWRSSVWNPLLTRIQWQLFPILLPLAIVLIARDLLEQSSLWHQLTTTWQIGLLSTASMLVVLLIFPSVLKFWLPTGPLPHTDLQKLVDRTDRELQLKLSETAEWQTGHRLANALVLGWLPGTRRILISDVLCWALTPPQLFAVFLHEAGHLKHHHLWWRLSVIVLAGEVLLLGSIATQRELNLDQVGISPDALLAILGMIGLLLLTALLMGYVSRALEFEADSFALEYMKAMRTDLAGSPAATDFSAGPDDLISAIRSTAELTGISPDQVTWMHPSISERIERLRLCQTSPTMLLVMRRRLRVLKAALFGVIVLCAIVLALHEWAWNT